MIFTGDHVHSKGTLNGRASSRFSAIATRLLPSPLAVKLAMALVDFYQQSILFPLRPQGPNLRSSLLRESATTRLVADGDPADDLEDHSIFIDIEDFMKSVLHVPSDWRARWGPVIHAVKRNPDFMKHYLESRVLHEKEYTEPEERYYEPFLLMNDVTLRVAFPATFSQDTPSTPHPLTQLVHIVNDGSSDCVLNEGSSIPKLVTEGNATRISTFAPN